MSEGLTMSEQLNKLTEDLRECVKELAETQEDLTEQIRENAGMQQYIQRLEAIQVTGALAFAGLNAQKGKA